MVGEGGFARVCAGHGPENMPPACFLERPFRIRLCIKNSRTVDTVQEFLVEEGGFEPPKSLTTDLQSAPFGHSGTPPYSICWSWWTDSNPRPADYKSAALPAELHQQVARPRGLNFSVANISRREAFCQAFFYFLRYFFRIFRRCPRTPAGRVDISRFC